MSIDLSPGAVTARVLRASALSDLVAGKRLEGKLDMSAEGVSRRLREAFDLLELCESLRASFDPSEPGLQP